MRIKKTENATGTKVISRNKNARTSNSLNCIIPPESVVSSRKQVKGQLFQLFVLFACGNTMFSEQHCCLQQSSTIERCADEFEDACAG